MISFSLKISWTMQLPGQSSIFRPVCFITQRMDAGEMDNFLRNTTLYILRNGPIIKDRDTMGVPNGTNWQARMCGEALCQPPRRTLRWFPYDGSVPPANLQPA